MIDFFFVSHPKTWSTVSMWGKVRFAQFLFAAAIVFSSLEFSSLFQFVFYSFFSLSYSFLIPSSLKIRL